MAKLVRDRKRNLDVLEEIIQGEILHANVENLI